MRNDMLWFENTREHDPAIEAWFAAHHGELGALARRWFATMRTCGDEVRELLHDGCPVACLGEFPFAYVNVFSAHMNIGFYYGASLPDPAHLLLGTGKRMRHLKLRAATDTDAADTNAAAIQQLIDAAFADIKARVEQ